ncbi:MAG TPA: efflux RND transporter permease subunit, partial [Anaeromyxobacteraceae bacterium]|nr:efflux RND transporter permease subunit [Anaeromyxobacteraceae bacterium]
FALTLAGAVTISGVVALTLSPVMSANLLRRGDDERGLPARINRGFERIKRVYARHLDTALQVRKPIYVAWIVVSLLAFAMFSQAPKELAPTEDQGVVFGVVNTPSNSTIDQIVPFTRQISKDLLAMPESDFTFQVTQPTGGFWGLALKPWDQRERTAFEIMPEVSQRLAAIPGVQTFAILPPALPGGGAFPVEVVLASTADTSTLLGFANQLQEKATKSGLFAFPPLIDVKIDQPESQIVIDRDKVAELGLDLQTVGRDIGAAVGGAYVNRFSIEGRSYKVIPQLARTERLNPEQLSDLHVTGPEGQLIPLASIARIEDKVTPRALPRFQQLNSVKISGVPIVPLDQALSFLEEEAAKI